MAEASREKKKKYDRAWIRSSRELNVPDGSAPIDRQRQITLPLRRNQNLHTNTNVTSQISHNGMRQNYENAQPIRNFADDAMAQDDNNVQSENEIEMAHVENSQPIRNFDDDAMAQDDNNVQPENEIEMAQVDSTDSENAYILSSSSDEEEEAQPLKDTLAEWTSEYQIKHNAVDNLLKRLQPHVEDVLPATARTLLKTKSNVQVENKSGMDYIHFNMAREIESRLQKYSPEYIRTVNRIEISLSIDGLPLFRSSKKCLWPVLACLHLEPLAIFPCVLTCGNSRPTDLHFLDEPIDEMAALIQHGLDYMDRNIPISLRCIVCDAPARAMVKCIKQYSGYYGCDKCNQKGKYLGKVVFNEMEDLTLRTDDTFRNKVQRDHHHGNSPFTRLPINMIANFPIDYMHQSCLGVMKRLLLTWMRGPRANRISAGQIDQISDRLLTIKEWIPNSFARKPRRVQDIDYWKATEYRQFLIYTGKVALKGILPDNLYDHFMSLSMAISILVSPELAIEQREYAHDLLEYFVINSTDIYGEEFLVYNVHCLLHLSSEVENFGTLDACSAFPFENYLQTLKRLVRSGKNPIAQVVKRLDELSSSKNKVATNDNKIFTAKPNNAYVLSPDACCEVLEKTNIVSRNGNTQYRCRVFRNTQRLFNKPGDSRLIGVYDVSRLNSRIQLVGRESLNNRAIMLPRDGERRLTFMQLLHTFD